MVWCEVSTRELGCLVAHQMRRTSYLAELESLYVYALRCKNMPCGANSPFFSLMQEYIDLFYDKSDVLEDLRPYLLLFNNNEDVLFMKEMFKEKVKAAEVRICCLLSSSSCDIVEDKSF